MDISLDSSEIETEEKNKESEEEEVDKKIIYPLANGDQISVELLPPVVDSEPSKRSRKRTALYEDNQVRKKRRKKTGRPKKKLEDGEKNGSNLLSSSTKKATVAQRPWIIRRNLSLKAPRNKRTPRTYATKVVPAQSIFLPEEWSYYCRKNYFNSGPFDQFYLTKDKKKLNSRHELAKYIEDHNLDLDKCNFFFSQKEISYLLNIGYLQYLDEEKSVLTISSTLEKSRENYLSSFLNEEVSLNPKRVRPARFTIQLEEEEISDPTIEKEPSNETKNPVDKESPSPPFGTLPQKPVSSVVDRCRNRKKIPISPYELIQEKLSHDPWQLLIATIFLENTNGKLAVALATEFLHRWPTPYQACQADFYSMLDVVEKLGSGRSRVAQIIRFSYEFLTKKWETPKELFGIGKYGEDSFKIFCTKNEWKKVDPDDHYLLIYLNWRKGTEHIRRAFKHCVVDPSFVDPDEEPYNV